MCNLGWEDAPLATEGRNEARNAGLLLKSHGIEFDVVYTSWLSRAIEVIILVLFLPALFFLLYFIFLWCFADCLVNNEWARLSMASHHEDMALKWKVRCCITSSYLFSFTSFFISFIFLFFSSTILFWIIEYIIVHNSN